MDVLQDSSRRKAIVPFVTGFCIIILTVLLIRLCKKKPPAPQPVKKVEDTRPKLSICGKTALSHPPTVSKLCEKCRVYLINLVETEQEEESVKTAMKETGVADHRIMFCSTEIGYKAMVRQLNPSLHIESSMERAREMRGYLNSIALVTQDQCEFFQVVSFENSHEFILSLLDNN